ncbi:unnamed protein product [Closterium sp. Yama58-4]|nr:unnamed protein product [Closterium sp. Yama58-4]
MQFELVRVDGTTPPLERAEAVKRFATEPQVRVAIVGVTAGGVGLDFSAAQTIVFAEIPRAAADLLQAEDRAHRRGQRFPVNVVIFCAKIPSAAANLPRFVTIVFAEIPRAAADFLQAEDRAYRRGQRFPENVVVFFCA